MKPNERQILVTVNQRVLGSSPRGGAKPSQKCGGFFVFIFMENIFYVVD